MTDDDIAELGPANPVDIPPQPDLELLGRVRLVSLATGLDVDVEADDVLEIGRITKRHRRIISISNDADRLLAMTSGDAAGWVTVRTPWAHGGDEFIYPGEAAMARAAVEEHRPYATERRRQARDAGRCDACGGAQASRPPTY